MSVFFNSEGHIGLERKVTKLEAMLKMLQEDLKKVGNLAALIKDSRVSMHIFICIHSTMLHAIKLLFG